MAAGGGGDARVPVTVLTGFLGSGKTTLLNRLLHDESHGRRLAVIENEFSVEIGVENELVSSASGAPFIEVAEVGGGCLCCSGKGEFVKRLKLLLETKRDRFDYIVVETTGLADPSFIATFFNDPYLRSAVYLDGVVTVVDCKNVLSQLDDEAKQEEQGGSVNEAAEQLVFADRVLLNKTDLVTDDEIKAVAARIKSINRTAPQYRSQFSKVDVKQLIDIQAFDIARILKDDDDFLDVDAFPRHDESVGSVVLHGEGELRMEAMCAWLDALAAHYGPRLLRCKGVLHIAGSDARHVFQGVVDLFDIRVHSRWPAGGKRLNQIVLIGKALDALAIARWFARDVGVQLSWRKLKMQGPAPQLTVMTLLADLGRKAAAMAVVALILVPQELRQTCKKYLPVALHGGVDVAVDSRWLLLLLMAAAVLVLLRLRVLSQRAAFQKEVDAAMAVEKAEAEKKDD